MTGDEESVQKPDVEWLRHLFEQVQIDDSQRYGAIRRERAAMDVVIVPALNRPYHFYYRLAKWLADRHHANVYIPDRYGGEDSPKTGIVRQQCDQLHSFFAKSEINGRARPLYMVGHSWGGLLALNFLAECHQSGEGPEIKAALLGAPFLRMDSRLRIPFGQALKRLSATCAGQFHLSLKHNSLAHTFMRVAHPGLFNDSKMVTHDPVLQHFEQRYPEFSNKSLNIAQIGEALQQQEWLRRTDILKDITTPVGILSAELEGFISNRENARIAKNLPRGWHATLTGAKHGFMHPDKETVFSGLQYYLTRYLLRAGDQFPRRPRCA